MSKLKIFFQQQIFPGFSALLANRKVEKIFLEQLEYDILMPDMVNDANRFKADIENMIKSQLERKGKLEDKAKSLLFIITLAITTATFSLSFLKDTEDIFISPILAVLSICCFVFAGVRVISAINIRVYYIRELPISYEEIQGGTNIQRRIVVSENEPNDYLKDLIRNKALNDLICTKIANLTYASFILVRNGIILFACFFAVSIVVQFSTRQNQKKLDANSKISSANEKENYGKTIIVKKSSVEDSSRLIKYYTKPKNPSEGRQ